MKAILFIFSFFTSLLFANIEVGSPAPSQVVTIETGETTNLAEHYKKGLVLVYFYPKADTPGCTKQACSLRDAYATLQKEGVTIFGASTDSVEDQVKFQKKHRIPFHLISDSKSELAKGFEVPVRLGFASRQAFLMKNGKIIWLDRSASTSEQANDVLKVLKNLK